MIGKKTCDITNGANLPSINTWLIENIPHCESSKFGSMSRTRWRDHNNELDTWGKRQRLWRDKDIGKEKIIVSFILRSFFKRKKGGKNQNSFCIMLFERGSTLQLTYTGRDFIWLGFVHLSLPQDIRVLEFLMQSLFGTHKSSLRFKLSFKEK